MPSVVCQRNNFFDDFEGFSSSFNFGGSRSPDTNTPDFNTPDSSSTPGSTTPDFINQDSNAPDLNFGNFNFDAFNSEPGKFCLLSFQSTGCLFLDCSGIAFCDVCRRTGNSNRGDDVECVLCSGARDPSLDGSSCIRRQAPSTPNNNLNLTSIVPGGTFSDSFSQRGTLPGSF